MLLAILFYIFIIIGLINTVHFAAFIIGANIYDVRALARARKYKAVRRHRFRNPLITILVPAYNEELSIERCLDSIKKNTYKKIQVVVINDASNDKTAVIVRKYGTNFPNFPLRLVSRRVNHGKASGLNYAVRRYARGDLVMTLDADSILHKHALQNVVKYFDSPETVGVAANVRILEELSVLGLLQRFEHMIGYRSKKMYTLLNCELIIGGVASTYRRSVLKKVRYYDADTVTEDIGLSMKIVSHGNKQNRLVYASDVLAMTESVQTFKALLNQRFRWKLGNLQNIFKYRSMAFSTSGQFSRAIAWYRMPMSFLGELMIILEPIVFLYVLYLSIRFFTPTLIIGAYMTITIYLLLTILPDEHLGWWSKLRAACLAPLAYFVFYVMSLVQVISVWRCLLNAKKITMLSGMEASWISPKRSGKAASFS